jgi:long-chain acyl-CoA synthetase
LQTVNATLEPHEKLACLAATATPWTPENGFVTPTLKVKRNRIEETFEPLFSRWLALQEPVVWADN